MKILVTGASGLVGSKLTQELIRNNFEVVVFTRNPESYREKVKLPVEVVSTLGPELIETIDAIIALAGENIGSSRWTDSKKKLVLKSRVEGINGLKYAMSSAKKFPKIFISASAIGIYDQDGFLKEVCDQWEEAIFNVYSFYKNKQECRIVAIRTGVVMSLHGGALSKMIVPFKFGLGGILGNGEQYVSWIHEDDLIKIYILAINNSELKGAIDAVAPHPVTNKELTKTLGSLLHLPTLFPVPAFMLKIILGEMSSLLLNSCKITPEKIIQYGMIFDHPRITEALKALGVGEVKKFQK